MFALLNILHDKLHLRMIYWLLDKYYEPLNRYHPLLLSKFESLGKNEVFIVICYHKRSYLRIVLKEKEKANLKYKY